MNIKIRLKNHLYRVLWIMPFFCFLTGYYTLDFFFHRSLLKTPCVIGFPLSDALQLLSNTHLTTRLLTYKEDPHLEPGTVLSQNPSPGSSIRPQQTVFLVISRAPTCSKTPLLVGKPFSEIGTYLKKQSLLAKTYRVPSTHPKEICIAQFPLAGSEPTTKEITLYLAQDTSCASYLVPSFKQKSLLEVMAFLKEHEISFTVFHTNSILKNHECTNCIVVEQKPLAGSFIHKNNPPVIQLQVNN